jgi:hypothetical protein
MWPQPIGNYPDADMRRTMKIGSDFDKFNTAMDTILKANPAAVKASMEQDKKDRAKQRKAKKSPSASAPSLSRKG